MWWWKQSLECDVFFKNSWSPGRSVPVGFQSCLPAGRHWGLPGGSDGKASAHNAGGAGSIPGSGRFSGEGNGKPLQYSCPKFHGWRSLVGYSPWGHKESDTTDQLHFLPAGTQGHRWKVTQSRARRPYAAAAHPCGRRPARGASHFQRRPTSPQQSWSR